MNEAKETYKDAESYRDAILSEFKDRIEIAEDNANCSETENEKDRWNGYADGVSDAIEVVSDFFDMFMLPPSDENENNDQ